jgi:hypothetical protein
LGPSRNIGCSSTNQLDKLTSGGLGVRRQSNGADHAPHLGTCFDHRADVGGVDPADSGDRTINPAPNLSQRLKPGGHRDLFGVGAVYGSNGDLIHLIRDRYQRLLHGVVGGSNQLPGKQHFARCGHRQICLPYVQSTGIA